jgi:NADH-quinone oxidoreductase subunit G
MPNVTINGKSIDVPKGTPIIRAAAMLGFNIPHFCYHPALSSPANCRMCLVEVEKARKLEPSCYLKCTDGMVVHTESAKVIAARRSVMEFILVNHPVDCPICDQAGECKLQDYYMAYDHKPSRLNTQKNAKVKVYPIGPHVVYDGERCILCTRCIRFCDEVTATSELTVAERGDRSYIRTFPGRELDNPYSMNVTDICPVGALTTRDFRFKCRVWLMSSTDSVCTGCSRGCNVHMEHFQGQVQRYRPRFNRDINEYWMCDVGRLSYKELHTDRNLQLFVKGQSDISWPRAARQVADQLKQLRAAGTPPALLLSAQASSESLWAARAFAESVLGTQQIYWTGKADGDSDELLIRSDKNPNRAGVEVVFGADVLANDARRLLSDLSDGRVSGLWMMGSALPFSDSDVVLFMKLAAALPFVALQASHRGALSDIASIVLPAATHAEQEGTFVNGDGHVQSFYRAFEPAGVALPDWQIFQRISRAAGVTVKVDTLTAIQADLYAAAGE